jgi:hypothetical protein
MLTNPKAESVTKEGAPDGWQVQAGFHGEREAGGPTRLLLSVPTEFLAKVHQDLVRVCQPPLSVLYRQTVDRQNPRPEGAPPRDFLALELDHETVIAAMNECANLVYHDARCEIWVRGRRNEQVILDADGILYCYPDDPTFTDVALLHGLPEGAVQTLLERDYVKHWYHAENDLEERAFIDGLGLTEMSHGQR